MFLEKKKPNIGLKQGSPLSPLLFNIYIDKIIINTRNNNSKIELIAFADDILIQGLTIEDVQNAFTYFERESKELDLEINFQKSELISDEELNSIIGNNFEEVESIASAKYLGQYINYQGKSTVTLKQESFGGLINTIKSYQLSDISSIKIFNIYCRSKINHLLPSILFEGGAQETSEIYIKYYI